MREEIGGRMDSEAFFNGFPQNSLVSVAQTEESIKNNPEPTSQIPKGPKYNPQNVPPEDAPFLFPSTVAVESISRSTLGYSATYMV